MRWQDFTLIGLRLLGIAGVAAAVIVGGLAEDNATVAIVAALGVVLIGIAGGLAYITATRPVAPYAYMLADWVIAGGFIYVTGADATITAAIIAFLALTLTPRIGVALGAFYLTILLTIAVGLAIYESSGGDLSQSIDLGTVADEYALPLILGLIFGIAALIYTYIEGRFGSEQEERLKKLAGEREAQLQRMQERNRAVTDMTSAVTATLEYDRILDAALDIGDFMVRGEASDHRVISMVLLFRDDNRLYIASVRGLKPEFEGKLLPAGGGLLARTLEEGRAMIYPGIGKDAVLARLPGFRQLRSVLCVPLRAHYDNFGLLLYGTTTADAFDPDSINILEAISVQATVTLQNAVLQSNLRSEKTRIMQMEEDARKSLVRDLHDVPTQTMAGISMRMDYAIKLLERQPDQVLGELQEIKGMATRAVTEIRHVLFKLRPLALESQGLIGAIKQLAEKMQDNYQQAVTVRVSEEVENFLDEPRQGTLFYLIEEAVNNARKYAEAPMIVVKGIRQEQSLIIQIADNGKGFDMEAVNESYDNRGSFGMVNMQERADLLGATLNMRSAPGKGTTVQINVPIIRGRDIMEIPDIKLTGEIRRGN